MIGIQLIGRLGNQMFQYAAARTLAEQLSCRLWIAGRSSTRRLGFIGHLVGLDRGDAVSHLREQALLHEAFGCGPTFLHGRAHELISKFARKRVFKSTFTPRTFSVGKENWEAFDVEFFNQSAGTWLNGLFQSQKYFTHNSANVRQWFSLPPRSAAQVDAIVRNWPALPERMAAVHVRRGDYVSAAGEVGNGQNWVLPLSYYKDAISRLPSGSQLALFSDDPDWAEWEFRQWRPWISRGLSPAIDMFLITRCRFVITANSTFSWWAAWLNIDPQRVIYAPKFHVGFRLGRWIPDAIQVEGWNYLEVSVN